MLARAVIFALLVALCIAACPKDDKTLTLWSSMAANMVENAVVTIAADQRVLLDVSPPTLTSIDVHGELYVDNANINIKTRFVSVWEGGSLIVGTPDCPISAKVVFTFYGAREPVTVTEMGIDSFDNQKLGSKGLSVRTNGTLLVYGWTKGPAWTNLAEIAWANQSTLVLREPVFWKAGDNIVVASTDYSETIKGLPSNVSSQWIKGNGDPDQSELAVVKSVSGNTVTLMEPLAYTHWAGHFQYAEVGLLTRHVVLQGDEASDDDEYGAQIMLRKGKRLEIVGAEVTRMGQKGLMGRYPIHFHFIHDATGLGYCVKQSSSHHNYQRGLTIHETHGVLIQDVVAFKTNGHMYFLEDGGEHNNIFDHNLGVTAYPVPDEEVRYGLNMQIIPTDTDPSIFWVTNPDNTFINNAACGGRFGFWYSLPDHPIGLTASIGGFYPSNYNPSSIPLKLFLNNTAHSAGDNCMIFDHGPDANGKTDGGRPYWGKGGNLNVFQKSTVYKCRGIGVWSITELSHSGSTFVDSQYGIFYNGRSACHGSTFVGASANIGRNPINLGSTCGIRTYDVGSPQHSYNNVFYNFTGRRGNMVSAAHCGQGSGLSPKGRMYNNTYYNSTVISNTLINRNKGVFVWNDLDGSATKVPGGAYVISPNQSLALPSTPCTYNDAVLGYVCDWDHPGFAQLTITDQTMLRAYNYYPATLLNGTTLPAGPATRYMIYDMNDPSRKGTVAAAGDGSACNRDSNDACESIFQNMPPRKMLTVKFTYNNEFRASPNSIRFQASYMNPGDWFFISAPYPTTATFWVRDYAGVNLTRVASFSQMTPTSYYYDSTTELLWVLIKSTISYSIFNVQSVYETDQGSSIVVVDAYCPNDVCAPTKSKLQVVAAAPALPFVENIYNGTLEACQVVPTSKASTGLGKVQVWYYPSWNEIHFSVFHDLPSIVTSVFVGVGGLRQFNYTLNSAALPRTSPVRGGFGATPTLVSALYNGNLFVQVATSEYPDGHLRAQLYCASGSCTKPNIIAESKVCKPADNSVILFENGVPRTNFNFGVYNISMESWGYEPTTFCGGNRTVRATVSWGQFQFSVNKPFAVNSTYKYLEFYVKTAPGSGIINPNIWLRTPTVSNSPSLKLQSYALDGQLDEDSGFQLVSIPLADFKLGDAFNLSTILWSSGSKSITFLLDQIRLTSSAAATTSLPLENSPLPPKSTCGLVSEEPTDGGSTSNGNPTNGNSQSTTGESAVKGSATWMAPSLLLSVLVMLVILA